MPDSMQGARFAGGIQDVGDAFVVSAAHRPTGSTRTALSRLFSPSAETTVNGAAKQRRKLAPWCPAQDTRTLGSRRFQVPIEEGSNPGPGVAGRLLVEAHPD